MVLDVRKEFHTWKVAEDNIDLTAAFVNDLNQQNNSESAENKKPKKAGSQKQRLIPFSIHLVYNCEYK